MSYSRRTFLVGAASGFSLLVLTACTDDAPVPAPTTTPALPVAGVPAPTSFHRSNWANDPYALGATSYLAVGTLPQIRETLKQPVLDRVYLAGEAISNAPGTVRGAVASGRSAANALSDAMEQGERVAVIGAGAAGAAAARVLTANGADVIVIESRDRTGGRIASYIEGEHAFELGAWRLSDEDDASLIDALAREGVSVEALAGGFAYALSGATAPAELEADDPALTAAAAGLAGAATWAEQQEHDVSLEESIRDGAGASDWPEASDDAVTSEAILTQAQLAVAGLTGADASELSAWFSNVVPLTDAAVPAGPLSSFVDAALEGIDTALSTVVVGVFYDSDGVSLRLGTGESLSVNRVIVTVPLGVLQEQVIEFNPPLPVSYRGVIDALSVGHIEVVRMEFDAAFWQTDAVWWVNENEDELIRTWVNLLPATGRPILLGVVGGRSAQDLAGLDDAAVRESAQRSLAPFADPGI